MLLMISVMVVDVAMAIAVMAAAMIAAMEMGCMGSVRRHRVPIRLEWVSVWFVVDASLRCGRSKI